MISSIPPRPAGPQLPIQGFQRAEQDSVSTEEIGHGRRREEQWEGHRPLEAKGRHENAFQDSGGERTHGDRDAFPVRAGYRDEGPVGATAAEGSAETAAEERSEGFQQAPRMDHREDQRGSRAEKDGEGFRQRLQVRFAIQGSETGIGSIERLWWPQSGQMARWDGHPSDPISAPGFHRPPAGVTEHLRRDIGGENTIAGPG
jgi:hypothetical protein